MCAGIRRRCANTCPSTRWTAEDCRSANRNRVFHHDISVVSGGTRILNRDSIGATDAVTLRVAVYCGFFVDFEVRFFRIVVFTVLRGNDCNGASIVISRIEVLRAAAGSLRDLHLVFDLAVHLLGKGKGNIDANCEQRSECARSKVRSGICDSVSITGRASGHPRRAGENRRRAYWNGVFDRDDAVIGGRPKVLDTDHKRTSQFAARWVAIADRFLVDFQVGLLAVRIAVLGGNVSRGESDVVGRDRCSTCCPEAPTRCARHW